MDQPEFLNPRPFPASAHAPKGQAPQPIPLMGRHRLIATIRQHNPTASPEFLNQFNNRSLHDYLDRLARLHNHRGPETSWSFPRPPRALRHPLTAPAARESAA